MVPSNLAMGALQLKSPLNISQFLLQIFHIILLLNLVVTYYFEWF